MGYIFFAFYTSKTVEYIPYKTVSEFFALVAEMKRRPNIRAAGVNHKLLFSK